MKFLVVTTIVPDKRNIGGPSGIIWEVIEFLKLQGHEIDIYNIPKDTASFQSQLHIMGLLKYDLRGLNRDSADYDWILLYPDVLVRSIPQTMLAKTVVLAPDATSMVRIRKCRMYPCNSIKNGIRKLYQYVFYRSFLHIERKYIKQVHRYLVVGINDRRWLRFHTSKAAWKKVVFLRHPLLSYSMSNLHATLPVSSAKDEKLRFVFAGDLSYSYVGNSIREIAVSLAKKQTALSILVVGKRNQWVYDEFLHYGGDSLEVRFIPWVENYQDVCRIGLDIHCMPLISGGGTKNRTVTAIANGLEVITTPIGAENIILDGVDHVTVCKNMDDFADHMATVQARGVLSCHEITGLLDKRESFRQRTTREFQDTLLSAITGVELSS